MRAYVQQVGGQYAASGSAAAAKGFEELGYEVVPFSYSDLLQKKLELSREWPVNGGLQCMVAAYKQLGIAQPDTVDYPASLEGHYGRDMNKVVTLGDIRAMESFDNPIFIKPVEQKLFTGKVLKGKRADNLIWLAHLANDTPLYLQEIVKFKSEWRVYVLNKEVVGIGHYGAGSPLVFPNPFKIVDMIYAYQDPPIAYSLDVGLREEDHETLVVEINDATSLGNYGCPAKQYARMIGARWFEVMGMPEQMKELL